MRQDSDFRETWHKEKKDFKATSEPLKPISQPLEESALLPLQDQVQPTLSQESTFTVTLTGVHLALACANLS